MIPARRSRIVGMLAGILLAQLLAGVTIYLRGFPYYGTGLVPNAPWWEVPLALLHLPAIEVLTLFGFCCGLRGSDVLTHVVRGGHIPMQGVGTVVLVTVNWVCWSLVGALAYLGLTWRRRRTPPPAPEAPA